MVEKEVNADDYKKKGNECMKNAKYMEAVLHYTFGIKFDQKNAEMYSNRSFAFLKSNQLHYALEDAEQAINIKPNWPKGYFRKAEVLFSAERYREAIIMYQKALKLQPDDSLVPTLNQCIQKSKTAQKAAEQQDKQMPLWGTAFGLVAGILLVLFESLTIGTELLQHTFLQVSAIILAALLGYAIASMVRKYLRSYKSSLLEKPFDLFGDDKAKKE